MASKISNREWNVGIAIGGTIDGAQWLIDLIPIWGELINAVLDVIVGIGIAIYLFIRGVNLIYRPKRLVSIVFSFLAEEFSLEIAPAWVFDMWYLKNDVQGEEAADLAAEEEERLLANTRQIPLYQDGMRMPYSQTATANSLPSNKSNSITVNNGVNQNGIRVVIGSPSTGNTMPSKRPMTENLMDSVKPPSAKDVPTEGLEVGV